jgi:hypothetical protein
MVQSGSAPLEHIQMYYWAGGVKGNARAAEFREYPVRLADDNSRAYYVLSTSSCLRRSHWIALAPWHSVSLWTCKRATQCR